MRAVTAPAERRPERRGGPRQLAGDAFGQRSVAGRSGRIHARCSCAPHTTSGANRTGLQSQPGHNPSCVTFRARPVNTHATRRFSIASVTSAGTPHVRLVVRASAKCRQSMIFRRIPAASPSRARFSSSASQAVPGATQKRLCGRQADAAPIRPRYPPAGRCSPGSDAGRGSRHTATAAAAPQAAATPPTAGYGDPKIGRFTRAERASRPVETRIAVRETGDDLRAGAPGSRGGHTARECGQRFQPAHQVSGRDNPQINARGDTSAERCCDIR